MDEKQNSPAVPQKDIAKIEVISLIRSELRSFSGPLPHPDILGKYEQVLSGSADRIVRMAELQMNHRHQLEGKALDGEISKTQRGQICGLILGVAIIVSAVVCVIYDQPVVGGILGGLDIAGFIGVFMYGSKKREEEMEIRRQTPPEPSQEQEELPFK